MIRKKYREGSQNIYVYIPLSDNTFDANTL